MQAVAVNCVFPVVILEDRKRLVGALEQNKAVLTVLIKNRTVYILGLLRTFSEIVDLFAGKLVFSLLGVRRDKLHILNLHFKHGHTLSAAQNPDKSPVPRRSGILVFHICIWPCKVAKRSHDQCADSAEPPHNKPQTHYNADIYQYKERLYCKPYGAGGSFYRKFRVVIRIDRAIGFAVFSCHNNAEAASFLKILSTVYYNITEKQIQPYIPIVYALFTPM